MKRMWSRNELKEIVKGTQGYNFANLVDKDGHPRFIEGSISVTTQTGLTINYGKWSLSGSHFMAVIAGAVEHGNTAEISLKTTFNDVPQWVKDKIYTLGHGDNVTYSTLYEYNDGTFDVSTKYCNLIKDNGDLQVFHENLIGDETNDIYFRVAFDLLIDNASE